MDFCGHRCLELNVAKTKFIVFGKNASKGCSVMMRNDHLEKIFSFDYLGVTLSDKFRWAHQINKGALPISHRSKTIVKLSEKYIFTL